MPLNETTEAQLLAYAYGELSAAEARAFEQRLQGDGELRAELASVMATRELLGQDARWGLDSKVDAPPPHLLEAIVRAEVLARPPEIRDARALAARPTLTARLSRWLVGGGVLVGAAAALMVVVSRGNDQAVLVAAESAPAPSAAEGALTPSATEELAPAQLRKNEKLDAQAPSADAKENQARTLESDEAGDGDPVAPLGLALSGASGADGADGAGGAAGAARGRARLEDGLFAADAPGEPTRPAASSLAKPDTAPAKDARDQEMQRSSKGGASSGADDDGAADRLSVASGGSAPDPAPPSAAPPPAEPAAPPATDAPVAAPSEEPSAKPSEASSLAERPRSGDMITRDQVNAELRRDASLRREQRERSKAKKAAPSKSSAALGRQDKAEQAGEKAPKALPGPQSKRSMQAEMALMSGYRELKEGRSLQALDEFLSAERLDARRALGSDAHVGQMRALLALKRPGEALTIGRRLLTRRLDESGVVDGLQLGAKLAEELGDLRSARELYSALLKVPAQKSAAAAALARLAKPAVRSAPMDAEAAAEPEQQPAAAAPAAD